MRNRTLFVSTLLASLFTFGSAEAVPCSNIVSELINGSFTLEHSTLSNKKALQKVTLLQTSSHATRKRLNGDGVPFTLHDIFAVSGQVFASDAKSEEVRLLSRFTQAATVTLPSSPDLCFLLWFSDDNQLQDLNVIIDQDPAGELSLGSNNKLDSSLYMTMRKVVPNRRR